MSMIYGERNEFNTKSKEIIMKGLSKLDAKEVRHCDIEKEMLDKLQCMYGKDCNVAQEKAEEPFSLPLIFLQHMIGCCD